jgi:PAS domain S-box-containing protein
VPVEGARVKPLAALAIRAANRNAFLFGVKIRTLPLPNRIGMPLFFAMEPTSDKRFDPHLAAQLLLDIAQERSLEPILKKFVERVVEETGFVVFQVWLIQRGDLCASCKYRPECADQSRCLHLVAGRGKTLPGFGKEPQPYEDLNARMPLNFGPVGEAVSSGQFKLLTAPDNQPISVAGFEWLRTEDIRECGIRPIEFRGEVLGALVSFAREHPPETVRAWGRIFADHIGAAIANVRAFDELRAAGNRLEQTNQRLERELAERKETEEKLRESEQRYRRIVDTASEGILQLDADGVIRFVDGRLGEMLGYEIQELVGRHYSENLFEEDRARLSARIAARRQGVAERYEQRFRRKDGSAVWMYVSATPIMDAENRYLGSFAMFTDVTQRRLAEDELHKYQEHLEEMVKERTEQLFEARVNVDTMTLQLAAQQEERKRIAQELHDTLLQGFTGIALKLEALSTTLPPALAKTKEQLQHALEQTDHYLGETRRSIWNLRSPTLQSTEDFSAALLKASKRVLASTAITLSFSAQGVVPKMDSALEHDLLRICEEALANVVKHARPTKVEVVLDFTAKEVQLQIQDNGCGFEPTACEVSKAGHFGLLGMKERVASRSGMLSVDSAPGRGTRLLVTIPTKGSFA